MSAQKATLAAGCFWGVQHYFDQVPGVLKTTVGYTGGDSNDPSYEQVCIGNTGHAEATLIEFDPQKVSYQELLKHFFRLHDPTQRNRQGPDIGSQYRSAIFYHDETQKQQAISLIDELKRDYQDPIATEVTPAPKFYPAEEYHQKFTEKTGRGACHVNYEPLNY